MINILLAMIIWGMVILSMNFYFLVKTTSPILNFITSSLGAVCIVFLLSILAEWQFQKYSFHLKRSVTILLLCLSFLCLCFETKYLLSSYYFNSYYFILTPIFNLLFLVLLILMLQLMLVKFQRL